MALEIGKMFGPVEDMAAADLDGWRGRTGEGNYQLVDVRQPAEYERGHIPGAVLVPLAELPGRSGELSPDLPVVVYCAVGGRSRAAARFLAGRGFSRVINLAGGIKAYRGATLPGPPDAGLALLEAAAGPEEALSLALALEQGLRAVYLALAPEADAETETETKKLLARLAAMEEGHIARLTARMKQEGLSPEGKAADTAEGGAGVEELAARLRPLIADPAALLDAAMAVELSAYDLYTRLAARSGGATAELLTSLAADELTHLDLLAAMRERSG